MPRPLRLLLAAVLLIASASILSCRPGESSLPFFPFFYFRAPTWGQLSLQDEPLELRLRLPRFARAETLEFFDDTGSPLEVEDVTVSGREVRGRLSGLDEGRHAFGARVEAQLLFWTFSLQAATWVELGQLDRPEECELLNDIECLLPFPSSRFLEPAATETGFRVRYPSDGLPPFPDPLESSAFDGNDGFSPMTQVLMHFPSPVDPERSRASRLRPGSGSYGSRSLEPDSPTLLLDLDAGLEPVLHFVERDVRAARFGLEREVLYLRPGRSLTPGHRYLVAMRELRDPDGNPVEAEPAFAALRDRRRTTIPAVEERRPHFEWLFRELRRAGVRRSELVLAFDFVVQSDADVSRAILAMRDRAFDRLATEGPRFEVAPFVAETPDDRFVSVENDCNAPGTVTWRELQGRFEVPLFLDADPLLEAPTLGQLVDEDGDGLPDAQDTMQANFSIAIPCRVLEPGGAPLPPLLVGHGLFGNGRMMAGTAAGLSRRLEAEGLGSFDRIAGATDFLGLSSFDFSLSGPSFIINLIFGLDDFAALPDRLRQGMTNTLVLARMLKQGHFNDHPAFQTPDGTPVLAGPEAELGYLGISLGGIMGIFFSALSPDVANVAVDVPASTFPILVQRSGAIGLISGFVSIQNPDPMSQALLWSLAGDLWARGDPGGYLNHVTRDPLPGSGAPKKLLMTVARYDGIVPNVASEITSRTLGLPNLRDGVSLEGSVVAGVAGITDQPGPLGPGDPDFVGAQIWYDLAMYDGELAIYRPPLANEPPGTVPGGSTVACDPHGRSFGTLVEQLQIVRWLQRADEVAPELPGEPGVIQSFCDGLCDGRHPDGTPNPDELPGGRSEPCDPRSEPGPSLGDFLP